MGMEEETHDVPPEHRQTEIPTGWQNTPDNGTIPKITDVWRVWAAISSWLEKAVARLNDNVQLFTIHDRSKTVITHLVYSGGEYQEIYIAAIHM